MSNFPLKIKTFKPEAVKLESDRVVMNKFSEIALSKVICNQLFSVSLPLSILSLALSVFSFTAGYIFSAVWAIAVFVLSDVAIFLSMFQKDLVKSKGVLLVSCFGVFTSILITIASVTFFTQTESPEIAANIMLIASISSVSSTFIVPSKIIGLIGTTGFPLTIALLCFLLTENMTFNTIFPGCSCIVSTVILAVLSPTILEKQNATLLETLAGQQTYINCIETILKELDSGVLLEIKGKVKFQNSEFERKFKINEENFDFTTFLKEIRNGAELVSSNQRFKEEAKSNSEANESGMFLNVMIDEKSETCFKDNETGDEFSFERVPVTIDEEKGAVVKYKLKQKEGNESAKLKCEQAQAIAEDLKMKISSMDKKGVKYENRCLLSLFFQRNVEKFKLSNFLRSLSEYEDFKEHKITYGPQKNDQVKYNFEASYSKISIKSCLYLLFKLISQTKAKASSTLLFTFKNKEIDFDKVSNIKKESIQLKLVSSLNTGTSSKLMDELKRNPFFTLISEFLKTENISQEVQAEDGRLVITHVFSVEITDKVQTKQTEDAVIKKNKDDGKSYLTFEPDSERASENEDKEEESVVDTKFFVNNGRLAELIRTTQNMSNKKRLLTSDGNGSTDIPSSSRYCLILAEKNEEKKEKVKSMICGKFSIKGEELKILEACDGAEILAIFIRRKKDFGSQTGVLAVVANNTFDFLSAGEAFKSIRKVEKENIINSVKLIAYFTKIESDFSLLKKHADFFWW